MVDPGVSAAKFAAHASKLNELGSEADANPEHSTAAIYAPNDMQE